MEVVSNHRFKELVTAKCYKPPAIPGKYFLTILLTMHGDETDFNFPSGRLQNLVV